MDCLTIKENVSHVQELMMNNKDVNVKILGEHDDDEEVEHKPNKSTYPIALL